MALTKVSRGLISTSIVDNGNATAITIDSSENVSFTGAATFSGAVTADDAGFYQLAGTSQLRVGASSSYNWNISRDNVSTGGLQIQSKDAAADVTRAFFALNGDISFYEDTGTTPKFFWDASAESLGIGTSSPNKTLEVANAAGGATISISTDQIPGSVAAKKYMSLDFTGYNNNQMAQIQSWDESSSTGYGFLTFSTRQNNSSLVEAMRIDSSGNLLVGKTTTTFGTAGIALRGTVADFTRDGGTPINVNRLTSDGSLIDFHKAGTVVGSIGTYVNLPYIGKADVNLLFDPTGPHIIPRGTNGGARDAAINLGASTNRFKDLYLSGGVFLGGTGAANKLDDYEEGAFTATLKGGSTGSVTATFAEYTKIGDTVHCRVAFLNVDTTGYSGHLRVEGLPFPMKNTNLRNVCTPAMYQIGAFTADYVIGLVEASTHVNFYGVKSANTWNTVTHNAGGNRYLEFNVTYNVA